jgi:CrcB protein
VDTSLAAALIATFVGGCMGGGLRFAVMRWMAQGPDPWTGPASTQVVNLTGSWGVGLLIGFPHIVPNLFWVFTAIGFLGSYTTVSAFSLDILQLIRRGARRQAFLHSALSMLGCPLAAALGVWLSGGFAR